MVNTEQTCAGHPPKSIDTKAFVHLQPANGGFEIPSIDPLSRAPRAVPTLNAKVGVKEAMVA